MFRSCPRILTPVYFPEHTTTIKYIVRIQAGFYERARKRPQELYHLGYMVLVLTICPRFLRIKQVFPSQELKNLIDENH